MGRPPRGLVLRSTPNGLDPVFSFHSQWHGRGDRQLEKATDRGLRMIG